MCLLEVNTKKILFWRPMRIIHVRIAKFNDNNVQKNSSQIYPRIEYMYAYYSIAQSTHLHTRNVQTHILI